MARRHHDVEQGWRDAAAPAGILIGALAAGIGVGYAAVRTRGTGATTDSASGRTALRRGQFGGYAVTGNTVTINRPRAELYAFWRDFANLPKFMANIEAVERTGQDTWVWTIAAPMGLSVQAETNVVEDRKDELISWRSVRGSDVDTRGHVTFRDAADGRGTLVEAEVAYRPLGGELGRWIAKLYRREPNIQGRHELKRFKMLMETGEVATSDNRR